MTKNEARPAPAMVADIPEGRMKCALRNSSEQRGAFAAEGKKAGAQKKR